MKSAKKLEYLKKVKRVVVKIGSGVLASDDKKGTNEETLRRFVADIVELEKDGRFEVVVVSSGAVMAGSRYLNLDQASLSIPMKQASAALGQVKLMNMYDTEFGKLGRSISQILLTHDDLSNRRRFLNARNAIFASLEMKLIPIINENDSAAVHEIKFGDNDTLAAMMTTVVDADLLLILSDVDGLYDSDPAKNEGAELIPDVEEIDDTIRALAGEGNSKTGIGGMKAKVMAAEVAAAYGIATWIIGGKREGSIARALREGKGGTFFYPHGERVANRKHWIAHVLKAKGEIVIDDGASEAIMKNGRSLLPSGIVEVTGKFESGESVSITRKGGTEFARGLVKYHAFELKQIMGEKSSRIEEILGYKTFDEVVHRNDLVLLDKGKREGV
jgi:glutamate 5-kinase